MLAEAEEGVWSEGWQMEGDCKWGAWERQKDGGEEKQRGERHKKGRRQDRGQRESTQPRQRAASIINNMRPAFDREEQQPHSGLGYVTSPAPTATPHQDIALN